MVVGSGSGGKSRRLRARTALPSLMLLLAASLPGCDHGEASPWSPVTSNGGFGGGAGSAFGSGVAGTGVIIIGGTSATGPGTCTIPEETQAVFHDRVVAHDTPARRELFTWTTAEQADELRADQMLLTRIEREGLGPGFAMDALKTLSTQQGVTPTEMDSIALARILSGPAFAKARYAWSEPWATRAGWPDETYGDQLVRILLREEAWLARYRAGLLDVVDMDNKLVPTKDVLAHPERLAGIYFVRDGDAGGPQCYGTFRGGGNGYREFIIGNEAMIEEWSLSTPEIRARLEADVELVQEFFNRLRHCPPMVNPAAWNLSVVCSWDDRSNELRDAEFVAYQGSLAIPSANYIPTSVVLVALIDQLKASLFEPNPLVVRPDDGVGGAWDLGNGAGAGGADNSGSDAGAGGVPPL